MALSIIIFIIVVIANSILAVVVFKNNPKSATNRIFSLLSFATIGWLTASQISLSPQFLSSSLFWIRLSIFFAMLQTLSLFLLSITIPYPKIPINNRLLVILIAISAFVMLINLTPLSFSRVEMINNSPNPIPGIGLFPFAISVIFLFLGSIVSLIKKLKRSAGLEKIQIKYMTYGIFLMLGLIIITIMIPVVFFRVNTFVPFAPAYMLIFLGITAYTIIQHKLFDIKIILTEVITIILWIILFAKIFVSQSLPEAIVDILVFSVIVVFGILLIRSVIREIEQRKILEDLTERLKQLDAQKDEFISMAAHELRAPMTAIKGYVSMVLEGDTGDIPEKARGFLADANNINDRLIRLVNNMLNVSRIEEGRMVYQEEVESLSRVLRSVFNQFIPEAQRKNLEYTLEIPPQVKDSVKVDPDRVQEIIGNLVSNAIKYTDTGSVKVKLSQSEPNTIRCEVVDTGPGISEEEQKQLFQKFRRAESSVGKTTGTGLGLYISRLLVEKFGGKIGLTSKPGSGSNFWFELPLEMS